MSARHIPLYVGGFMLLPYLIWLVLWTFVFPGPKQGIDSPLSLSMFAVSAPLVVWFFLSNLGQLSNSIDGHSEFHVPRTSLARRLLPALAPAALMIGLASLPILLLLEQSPVLTPLPLLLSLLIAWAIRAGEAAREADHRSAYRDDRLSNGAATDASLPAATAARVALRQVGRLLLRGVLMIPGIGHLLRDALRGGPSAWGYLGLNVALVAALSILIFGLPAFMTVLLGSVVTVFVALVAITLD